MISHALTSSVKLSSIANQYPSYSSGRFSSMYNSTHLLEYPMLDNICLVSSSVIFSLPNQRKVSALVGYLILGILSNYQTAKYSSITSPDRFSLFSAKTTSFFAKSSFTYILYILVIYLFVYLRSFLLWLNPKIISVSCAS